MIEILDNTAQCLAAVLGCGISLFAYCRGRGQAAFLLTCFYGCFALGSLYWTLYLLLFDQTPHVFYVSEIVWISSCIFLYLLQYTLTDPAERAFRHPLMPVVLAAGAVTLVFYCLTGDIFTSAVRCGVMTALAWGAVRGLTFAGHGGETARARQWLHTVVLCFTVLENALWISSAPWQGDTLANPYFWIDFLLTGTLLALLPAVGKAVGR